MTYDYWIGPTGVFASPLIAVIFSALQFAFMLTESRRSRRAPADARRAAIPAFPNVLAAILLGLLARLLFGFLKIGVFDAAARGGFVWLGVGMVLAGWALRVWSQAEAGKFFTGEVAVQRDHRVITSGPYRWVRHPSYTGGVIAAIGFGLLLNTWLGALISGALLIWAYALRVPREEALLEKQLGDAYTTYMARTKRFVPYLI